MERAHRYLFWLSIYFNIYVNSVGWVVIPLRFFSRRECYTFLECLWHKETEKICLQFLFRHFVPYAMAPLGSPKYRKKGSNGVKPVMLCALPSPIYLYQYPMLTTLGEGWNRRIFHFFFFNISRQMYLATSHMYFKLIGPSSCIAWSSTSPWAFSDHKCSGLSMCIFHKLNILDIFLNQCFQILFAFLLVKAILIKQILVGDIYTVHVKFFVWWIPQLWLYHVY